VVNIYESVSLSSQSLPIAGSRLVTSGTAWKCEVIEVVGTKSIFCIDNAPATLKSTWDTMFKLLYHPRARSQPY
jgi:hypothetical protein